MIRTSLLVEQAKAGDQQAMLEIINRYMWLIIAHSRMNGMIDEDCKQTVIEQVSKPSRHSKHT
ncbi:MAG: helix-turn-helix domain-containing protein [Clostridia bacterium]